MQRWRVCRRYSAALDVVKCCIEEGYLCSGGGRGADTAGVRDLTPGIGRHCSRVAESGVDGAHLTDTAGRQRSGSAYMLKAPL